MTPTDALGIADAYACIRALVDAARSLPLHTCRRTTQGRVPVECVRLEGGEPYYDITYNNRRRPPPT